MFDRAGLRSAPFRESLLRSIWASIGGSESLASPKVALERDDFSSNRHPALSFCLSMIFSENRYPPSDQVRGHAFPDHALALQLSFVRLSESMGNHDSNIVDAGSV